MELLDFQPDEKRVKPEEYNLNLSEFITGFPSFDMKSLDVDRLLRISPLIRRTPRVSNPVPSSVSISDAGPSRSDPEYIH